MSLDGKQGNPVSQHPLTISVIVPVYNREGIIGKTISTILDQSRKPDQIVFCDDGSRDGSVAAIHNALCGSQIPYLVVEVPNSGPSNARKVAVEHATGSWFFFLDSDDRWQHDYLEDTEKLIHEHRPEAVVSNFRKVHVQESEETFDDDKFSEAPEGFWASGFDQQDGVSLANGPWLFEQTLTFQPCFPSALACSREAYDRVGGITLKSTSLKSEDSHFTRKLYFYCKVAFQHAVQVHIVIHGGNRSMAGSRVLHSEKLAGRVEILKIMLADRDVGRASGLPLKKAIERNTVALFNSYYWSGEYQRALQAFRDIRPGLRSPKLFAKRAICWLRARQEGS